jgi:diaminopimelate epimerase
MKFFKTVSYGNDFIHVENDGKIPEGDKRKIELAKKISARHTGPGADGVVFYRVEGGRPICEIINRDGSPAEISGNGLSGLAAVLLSTKKFSKEVCVLTPVGDRSVSLISRDGNRFRLRVEIGNADFNNHSFFPFLRPKDLGYSDQGVTFYPVSTGNPHVVVDVSKQEYSKTDLEALGRTLAGSNLFPRGTNVEIIRELSSEECRVFFYERGVGPTESSSTGCAAVFAVLRQLGKIKDHLSIRVDYGKIEVFGDDRIYVENQSEIVYKGVFPDNGEI